LNVHEVAASLGVTVHAVRKAIVRGTMQAGRVPGGRRGSYYVVDPLEVERYRRAHKGRHDRRASRG
jgi:hypothetical protein